MSELIECAARAIAIAAFKTHNRRDGTLKQYKSPEAYADERWTIYKLEGIAAVEAMSEPTAAMKMAGYYAQPVMELSSDDIGKVYRAMICEALKCPS